MAYAVLEGVVFSLYDIACSIHMPHGGRLLTGGGSAKDMLMARIKADLFEKDIVICRENDTSALGAAMCAMIGCKEFNSFEEAASVIHYEASVTPSKNSHELLHKRFALYRSLYTSLKNDFTEFNNLKG